MNKKSQKLLFLTTGTLTLLLGVIVYAFFAFRHKGGSIGNYITIIIPLLIVIFMAFFIIRSFKDRKQGQPLEDELSRKVITMAAAKSFYISLYWLLAISWLDSLFAEKLFDTEKLDASQTIGGGIGGMAIIFFICWFYYNKKGTTL